MEPVAGGQLLTLAVDGRRLGVPAGIVREVARMPRLTAVPHAPPAMMGLANVRGTVVPVLSLARLTGGEGGGERRLVVIDAAEPIGLAVDGVAELVGVRDADSASVEPIDAVALCQAGSVAVRRHARATAGNQAIAVETAANAVSLVTFAIGSQAFAFALDAVEEVLRLPPDIAAMPHAERMVVGSVEVRGALLPLLLLSELLALPSSPFSARTRVLVVRIGEQRVGLVVDAMHTVVRIADRDIDPVPIVLTRGHAEARIQAVCRLGNGKLVSVLAPEHLLREDITAQLRSSGPAKRVSKASIEHALSEQFLAFSIGEASFGLPVAAVERVAMLPARLSQLPRSPAFVRGVMQIGAHAVPVIDQARRFGAAALAGPKQRVVVVTMGPLRAGFLVDAVAGVRRIPATMLRPSPDLGPDAGEFEQVVTDAGERLMLILSPSELLERTEQDLLQAMAKGAPAL